MDESIYDLFEDSSLIQAHAALIRYPRFKELHADIRQCQFLSKIAGEPQCMSLEGLPGAGKTTLVKEYAKAFPRIETGERTLVPVFYVPTPSPVTIKGMATKKTGTSVRSPVSILGNAFAYSLTSVVLP